MLTDALLCVRIVECQKADMAKLADAPDLGSGSERSEGSSPFIRIVNGIVCESDSPTGNDFPVS